MSNVSVVIIPIGTVRVDKNLVVIKKYSDELGER